MNTLHSRMLALLVLLLLGTSSQAFQPTGNNRIVTHVTPEALSANHDRPFLVPKSQRQENSVPLFSTPFLTGGSNNNNNKSKQERVLDLERVQKEFINPCVLVIKFLVVLLWKGMVDSVYYPLLWTSRYIECQSLDECSMPE